MNPRIPEIFKKAVNSKRQKEQNPENGQNQQFMIRMELIRIKRLQNNNNKGQKDAKNQTYQYFSLDGGCKMDLLLEECHFAITYQLYRICPSARKQIDYSDPAWAIQNLQTILFELRTLFPVF